MIIVILGEVLIDYCICVSNFYHDPSERDVVNRWQCFSFFSFSSSSSSSSSFSSFSHLESSFARKRGNVQCS